MSQVLIEDLPKDFVRGSPLPNVLRISSIDELPKDVQNEIFKLQGAKPLFFLFTIFKAYVVIFGLIMLAILLDNIYITIIAIIVIATRQHVLALLIHEQSHGLGFGFRSKWGNLVANLFCALPLIFVTIESYAKTHLAHHKYFFTKHDPDFIRKNGIDWTFPMSKTHFVWLWCSDVLGINIYRALVGEKIHARVLLNNPTDESPVAFSLLIRTLYYLFFIILFTYFELWTIFALYWLVPMLTFFQLFMRLGAINEHKYNVLSTNINDSTPIIIPRWWEKLILPNLNFGYHIYHHYYPQISFVFLPQVHSIYKNAGLVVEDNIFYGYFSFIKYLRNSV